MFDDVHVIHEAPEITPGPSRTFLEVWAVRDADEPDGWSLRHRLYPVLARSLTLTYTLGDPVAMRGKIKIDKPLPKFPTLQECLAAGWLICRSWFERDFVVLAPGGNGTISASEIGNDLPDAWSVKHMLGGACGVDEQSGHLTVEVERLRAKAIEQAENFTQWQAKGIARLLAKRSKALASGLHTGA